MNWLKSAAAALLAAGLAFLAFMAAANARRNKQIAEKWQQKAIEEKQADTAEGLRKANQALTQAKLHKEKAKQAKAHGKKQLDKIPDSDMADIVSGWRVRK